MSNDTSKPFTQLYHTFIWDLSGLFLSLLLKTYLKLNVPRFMLVFLAYILFYPHNTVYIILVPFIIVNIYMPIYLTIKYFQPIVGFHIYLKALFVCKETFQCYFQNDNIEISSGYCYLQVNKLGCSSEKGRCYNI